MLIARIAESNKPSISLFHRLGFTITKDANVFGEVEMRFTVGDTGGRDTIRSWGEAGIEIHYPFG